MVLEIELQVFAVGLSRFIFQSLQLLSQLQLFVDEVLTISVHLAVMVPLRFTNYEFLGLWESEAVIEPSIQADGSDVQVTCPFAS